MSVNTGRFYTNKQDNAEEAGYRVSKENDKIDRMYGFERVKDTKERTGYLINMHSTEILNEDKRLIAALDLFFIQMDGTRFKASVVYAPYLLAVPREGQALDVARYLLKKYSGVLQDLKHIVKEDLELPNHLSGKKLEVLQLFFANNNAMMKVRRDLMGAVKRNKERDKDNTLYMKMLSNSLAAGRRHEFTTDNPLDFLVDIREHDVPHHVRTSIDLKVFCGLWYDIRCNADPMEQPMINPRPDLVDRPEPIVLAFDIETTKLPLKFPDAQSDQVMMISYMIDGQGYLITNREIISHDVDDFEYTPKPEFEGNFVVFNEESEKALLQRFFDHITDIKPHIFVTYNGDFFDWPFIEARAAVYDLDMKREIGVSKNRDGNYLCRPAMHMDCLCWVKRDSYLPVGSQGLKAVAKAKLRYDPVELDPEDMCKMAVEQPQVLSNYSVSDAVATYYLYMKYVHPFIFALATIIPMEPDEVLRKGSGTLCESLLMKEAKEVNIIFPNKQMGELNKLTADGHVIDTETYVGGHVEALESGVFRADIPCKFKIDQKMILKLQSEVDKVLRHAIEVEEGVPLDDVINLAEIKAEINGQLQQLHDCPARVEQRVIVHLDVGAMYPNIILTNRLQPSAMVTDQDCATCDYNRPGAKCKRNMEWLWRGDMLPANKNEFQRIQQQLETEKFPPILPGGPQRAFHELSKEDQAAYEKKRLQDYCRKAYKKTKVTKMETRTSTVCQQENSFYVDTVRAFRDRRYEYKGMTKVAKAAVVTAVASGDASEIKAAKGREVLYDSLQLAHKCILNSFYGYVMRKGARWMSMPMAGIVCLTGANIITKAREIIEKVGRPLELDTDGIWCILPATFPQEYTVHTMHAKKKKFNISYPNAVLNSMVKDHFTNDQYHNLISQGDNGSLPEYEIRSENTIFFEVDGPYLAMVLPAAKEEGKKLKKRYAVFNFDGTLAELKGFEIKRRGELQLIKIFQSSVFEAFLQGTTLDECYASVAKVADYWLDVLYSKGYNMPDSELFELISENRSMSRKLEDYGTQKSTSISTAKRLAEFLGDQMVKDAGLACRYIISKKPEGSPVTERAIPLAIFQSDENIRRHYLRKWLKDNTIGDADIRELLDWNYYIERLGGAIQKIITIPAALQGLSNPVPRVQHPDWLHKKVLEKNDILKQRRINEIFAVKEKPTIEARNDGEIDDIEDFGTAGSSTATPVVTSKRRRPVSPAPTPAPKTWREAVGNPPTVSSKDDLDEWIRFQKRKWRWQLDQRKKLKDPKQKRARLETQATTTDSLSTSRPTTATVAGFMRRAQQVLLEKPWQVIQAYQADDRGNFIIWAMVDSEMHKIKLTVPRIFYVNQRIESPPSENETWKKVNRILPRSRPVHNLYRYVVPEQVFHDNQLGMLVDLATPDIEGIYETQMTLQFRLLMDIGCMCTVERAEARRLMSLASKDIDNFSSTQLEFKSIGQSTYLENFSALKKIFLYQHSIPSGKREMWGLFMEPIKKAVIIVLDTVRTNQLPNLKTLYTNERLAYIKTKEDENYIPPVEEFTFVPHQCLDMSEVMRHITRALTQYQQEKKGPTVICMQTITDPAQVAQTIPILTEFPQIPIHITDDAALLSGLEWQRLGVRSMVRHFLNLPTVIDLMLDQCRYFHLPVGNMPKDTLLFGADLFYSRLLKKQNFVLWWSTTNRPDLGGRESDDNRLLAEFEENVAVVQNKPGFYPNVCVELSIDSLAVSALLQASRIHDVEGASSAITFDTIPQASLDEMVGSTPSGILPTYDETTLCSAAFRIMRQMINMWLREVSLNRNLYSDYQIIHFYRWIRSSRAYLYDPALRRTLNTLMRKLFLQIVAEFQRLGAEIIYADFTKIIMHTNKKSTVDAIANADYIVQSLRNKELFHSIHISYQQSWDFLLWMDTTNYAGIRGVLPNELRETDETTDPDEVTLEMNWAIAEHLPEDHNCRENFEDFFSQFMESLAEGKTPTETLKSLSHVVFEMIQKMHNSFGRVKEGPALEFIKAVIKVLAVDSNLQDELTSLRRNMLRLIGIGEFSDLAVWKDQMNTYVLSEVICKACNHCRDLDLCKDKHRAMKNGKPVWLCSQCLVCYDNQEIEMRIIDVVQRKTMSYALQDLRCIRCKQIKRENMSAYCNCAGEFETLVASADLRSLFGKTLMSVADRYEMLLLKELLTHLLDT